MRASELAKERGVKKQGFERWLRMVDQANGGSLLKKFGAATSPLWVNVRKFESIAGDSGDDRDKKLQSLRIDVDNLLGYTKNLSAHIGARTSSKHNLEQIRDDIDRILRHLGMAPKT